MRASPMVMTRRLLAAVILPLLLLSTASAEMVRVTVSLANIRSEAGSQYKIIASAKEGDLLPVVDSIKEWWKVRLQNGEQGWIYKGAAHLEKETYHVLVQAKVQEILGDYVKWATINDVYLEEYKTARLDIMVTPEWSRLDSEHQKSMMMQVAREFSLLCEEDRVLKTRNRELPYVAFFDRFNTLLGKANKHDAVLAGE